MGYDYALVHTTYTIPPAIALSFLYRPLLTSIDVYKVIFLVIIACLSTTPWDSYLIRHHIWTYPPNVIIGPTIFKIPIEEFFFFIIQTYNTSVLYLLLSKSTFHPTYLRLERTRASLKGSANESLRLFKWGGQLGLGLALSGAVALVKNGGSGTYLGLIIGWAVPFLLLLWTFAYQFLIGLPWTNTVLPIALPTVYLWIVDTLALKRGTWVIESGTKLGIHLWPGLEIEEAIFFLITNMLIVFGLVAFDNALAILNTFTPLSETVPELPSPVLLVKALLRSKADYDEQRIAGLEEAVERLRAKSRSFYLASGVFQGRLRVYLIILYSFCRVADDLVDDASTVEESREWIQKLREFLDKSYGSPKARESIPDFVKENFPVSACSALMMLPTDYLSKYPLYELLRGFEMDLVFSATKQPSDFPIKDEKAFELYGARVAGTVAQLCLELVFVLSPNQTSKENEERLIAAGSAMGIALQYVNISRDIHVDALMKRVYIPTDWLREEGLNPQDVILSPKGLKIDALRGKILSRAFNIYASVRGAIEELPLQARGPIRVAVESYMEIGRVLQEGRPTVKRGRATVPKMRRVMVAWKALSRS